MRDLERSLERLASLAEHDPDRACTQFEALVAWHGHAALARALQGVSGNELATLTRTRHGTGETTPGSGGIDLGSGDLPSRRSVVDSLHRRHDCGRPGPSAAPLPVGFARVDVGMPALMFRDVVAVHM